MRARRGNDADGAGSAGDAPREDGGDEIDKEPIPEDAHARSKERKRRQTDEQKGRSTYGEHRQLIREESKGEIEEENRRQTKAVSGKGSSGHTLVGGGREEKRRESRETNGARASEGNKSSPVKGKSSEKLISRKPTATESRYTLHNIELVPVNRGETKTKLRAFKTMMNRQASRTNATDRRTDAPSCREACSAFVRV